MYCPHCGEQDTIMLGDSCNHLFTKENRPSIPRGDAMYASIKITKHGPDLVQFLCNMCGKWFAIFCIPSNIDEEAN